MLVLATICNLLIENEEFIFLLLLIWDSTGDNEYSLGKGLLIFSPESKFLFLSMVMIAER